MIPQPALLLGAVAGLLLPGTERIPARPAGASDAATFETLSLHVEVDLPGRDHPAWAELVRTGNLLHLPAELVLEVECGEALSRVRMLDASGTALLELGPANLPAIGFAELALQSPEMPLVDILRAYPPGEYQVIGWTPDGRLVEGTVALAHDFPGLYAVAHPLPGGSLSASQATIAWSRSRAAVRYRLEIEDGKGFGFEITLPPTRTSITLPAGLLQPGTDYEYSLVSEGDTDNELELEGTFFVRP